MHFIMGTKGKQTEIGKAFEYACAYVVSVLCERNTEVRLVDSPQLITAKNAFHKLADDERKKYIQAAKAAFKIISRLEPMLFNISEPLYISLQADSQGIQGDVRDVLCAKGTDWEIGLSCKHNHEAVKHSRLSANIDFGNIWFGIPCSLKYKHEVSKIFQPLAEIRERSKKIGRPVLWSEVENKEEFCYKPLLEAFMNELKRLDKQYPKEIPALLIKYLIGKNDFYKVIMDDSNQFTKVESFNINDSLNRPCGSRRPLVPIPHMKLPTKFYEVGFKDGSKNTIVVVCDEGWNVSMRIHNASSKVEPSLKFDVQLISTPNAILTQIEPWEKI